MPFDIYRVDIEIKGKHRIDTIIKTHEMSAWLKKYGQIGNIYELCKENGNIQSRWIWKSESRKQGGWGRMSKPKKVK